MTEEKAREMDNCPKCGISNCIGLVVCWSCFKHIDDPFKTTTLSFEDWLKA